jgi:hypothetical protein
MYSVVPQSHPSLLRAVLTERNTEGTGGTLSAGVTGENSPYYTNQPRKMKMDRVLVNVFQASGCLESAHTPSRGDHFA